MQWFTDTHIFLLLQFYSEDSFGLRTLNEQGRVKVFEVPGVQHLHWHHNKQIFQKYIEPYLKWM